MQAYSKSRLDVAKAINALTVDTPLFKCGGDIPASAIGTTDGGAAVGNDDENPSSAAVAKATNAQQIMMGHNNTSTTSTAIVAHEPNPTSFAAVHLQLHKKNKVYHKKYIEHILTYASDWERILSTRVNKHLKHAEKLRVDLDHYQKKVEELNKDANKTMTKGKSVSDKGVDKLKRNEQKLVNARREHEQFVSDLCGFMEEIMERGWKDLHPLLVKMAQFDVTLSGEEAKLLSTGMVAVVGALKTLAGNHPNMNPTGRLKELETWSLESINKTNPRATTEPQQLTITGGDEFGVIQRASSDELDVGGGGLFGSSAPNNHRHPSTDNLFGSAPPSRQHSADNLSRNGTGDSFDWNAGIAPEATTTALVPTTVSAPSSGYGLPPLPRSNGMASPTHGSNGMGNSMVPMLNTMQAAAPPPTLNDIFGAAPTPAPHSGGFNHQPTGMPPPPPVMPPPPPPPQSPSNMGTPMQMYNSSPMVNGSSHMYTSSPMTQPPPVSSPMAQHQQQPPTLGMNQMSLGGGAMAPAVSSNPFGTQGPPAQKVPTNPFEF